MPITIKKSAVRPVIEITDGHTGKMLGMQSISTSCRTNPGCIRNSKIPGSICEKCYAQTMLQMYKDLDAKTERNTEVLTTRIVDWDDLPVVNCQIFRFESFGDIHNETHLQNYINIAKKNPGCMFTLWTKNYKTAYDYFKVNECPENFTLIISSLFINKKQDLEPFKKLGKFKKGQLKVFTVYDYGYIHDHPDDVKINCGSRLCMGCQLCYRKNEVEEINEILKSDQEKTESFLDTLSDDFDERMSKEMEEIIDFEESFENDGDESSEGKKEEKEFTVKVLEEDAGEGEDTSSSEISSGTCGGCCAGCPYANGGCAVHQVEPPAEDEFIVQAIKDQKIDKMVEVIHGLIDEMKKDGKQDVVYRSLHNLVKELCYEEEDKDNEDSEGKDD